VEQLRFTRAEFLRGLDGVTEADAARHFAKMNCISWNVGHMAWQEQRQWLEQAQGQIPVPILNEVYAFGAPMSTPPLAESLDYWRQVTQAADPYLDTLTTKDMEARLAYSPVLKVDRSFGSGLQRLIYHYWYHTGEIQAIRQMLGQTDLPQFVGSIEADAPYRPE